MKKYLCLFLLLASLGTANTFAQDVNLVTKKANALERKYLRPTLMKIYVSNGSSESSAVIQSLKTVKDEKFDSFDFTTDEFIMNNIPEDKNERKTAVTAYMNDLIKSQKFGNQVMHQWFPVGSDGNLTYDVLMQRGEYAATDNDVMKANSTKLGRDYLNMLGEQLIDRTYLCAYVVQTTTSTSKDGKTSTSTNVIPYTYKLNFNDSIMTIFYDQNYSDSGIDAMEFPMVFVHNANSGVHVTDPKDAASDYENIMTIIGKKVADFQVKSPVTFTHPIRANIGKKEGVRCDKRFAVMREVLDEKTGETRSQRVATVRATNKIFDNRGVATGNIDPEQQTQFYEVKGRKVVPGETLVENPDFGFNVGAEYTISEAALTVEYRLGQWLKVPGLFVYLKAGIPWSKGLGGIKLRAYDKDGELKNFQIFEGSLGIAKEFNLAGTFAVTPSIEGGYLIAPGAYGEYELSDDGEVYFTKGTLDKSYDTKSYKVGAHVKFGYYITRNIQFYANIGYNYYIKDKTFDALREFWANTESKREKFQKFQPMAFGLGLKVGF